VNRRINHRGPKWRHWLDQSKDATVKLALGVARSLRMGRLLPRGRNRRVTTSTPTFDAACGTTLRDRLSALLFSDRVKSLGRKALMVVLPLAVAATGFATPVLGVKAYKYVMQTGHFYVKDVLVAGNDRLTYEDIRELASLKPNTHLLATDLEGMEVDLERHPWVAAAHVQRELPNRLIVRISEHKPVAYVALGELWLVNRAGVPFTKVDGTTQLDLPIITGVSVKALENKTTRERSRARIRAAVSLARLYRTMGLDNRWPIGEINIGGADTYSLVLSRDGTQVALGQHPFRHKLYKLEWVLENLRQRQRVADYVLLDLSRDGRDDGRVIVKADVAPTTAEKARESSQFASPLPAAEAESESKENVKRAKKKLKNKRRKRMRRKNKRKNHILPRPTTPRSESTGRGA
jgi:cell division protein FtsQ